MRLSWEELEALCEKKKEKGDDSYIVYDRRRVQVGNKMFHSRHFCPPPFLSLALCPSLVPVLAGH